MPMLSKEAFIATARKPSDADWAVMAEDAGYDLGASRQAFTAFGHDGDPYIMFEKEGQFFAHAWWYAPVARTKEASEECLYKWYVELYSEAV